MARCTCRPPQPCKKQKCSPTPTSTACLHLPALPPPNPAAAPPASLRLGASSISLRAPFYQPQSAILSASERHSISLRAPFYQPQSAILSASERHSISLRAPFYQPQSAILSASERHSISLRAPFYQPRCELSLAAVYHCT